MFHKLRLAAVASSLLAVLPTVPSRAENYYGAYIEQFTFDLKSQGGTCVAFDSRGNVIAAGFSQRTSGENSYAGYVIKYDLLDGHILWQQDIELNGSNQIFPRSITTDKNDNIVVACTRTNASQNDDFYIVKYTPTGGIVQGFPQIYNGLQNGADIPVKVVTDSEGSIYAGGSSVGENGAQEDYITVKYNSAGTFQWEDRINFANRKDVLADMAVDANDNIITCGLVTDASNNVLFYLRKVSKTKAQSFTPISLNIGGDYGASGVGVDTQGNIFVSGMATNGNGYRALYTAKYGPAGVNALWAKQTPYVNSDFNEPIDSLPYLRMRQSILTIAPNGNPTVSATMKNAAGTYTARTIRYDAANGNQLWEQVDAGPINDDTNVRGSITDGSSNTIIVGETGQSHGDQNSFINDDIYVAKYSATDGTLLWSTTLDGSYSSSSDRGTALALDLYGNIAINTVPVRNDNGIGRSQAAIVKFNRFIAETGDNLANATNGIEDGEYSLAGIPATNDNGSVTAKASAKIGRKKADIILSQGPGGGNAILALNKDVAPGFDGNPLAAGKGKFSSLSDPLINNGGAIAFPAKVSGVAGSMNEGIWTTMSGQLRLTLQKGVVPSGLTTEKLTTISSFSLRTNSLVTLAKIAAPGTSNVVLLNTNNAGTGNVLLRTGNDLAVNGVTSKIKKFSLFTPTKTSPADGRWHGDNSVVATVTLADKRVALVRVNTAGTVTPMLYNGGLLDPANTAGPTFKSFGYPAVSSEGTRYATLGTLVRSKTTDVTSSNDTAILYSSNGTAFSAAVRADDPTPFTDVTFKSFSDPLVTSDGNIAFVGTLAGKGVKGPNSKAIFFGFKNNFASVARLGDHATDPSGFADPEGPIWSSFTSFVLPDGDTGAPVFLAKLSKGGANGKNNQGVWAKASDGTVRQLMRTGELLDGRTVKSFNVLKPVAKAFAAARSFNNRNSVVVAVAFTDKTTALVRLAIP